MKCRLGPGGERGVRQFMLGIPHGGTTGTVTTTVTRPRGTDSINGRTTVACREGVIELNCSLGHLRVPDPNLLCVALPPSRTLYNVSVGSTLTFASLPRSPLRTSTVPVCSLQSRSNLDCHRGGVGSNDNANNGGWKVAAKHDKI